MEIKNNEGDVIYTSNKGTTKEAIVEAVNSDADLRSADLRSADLRSADLSDAYLIGANLSGADLRRADLSGAYLSGADLSDANLSDANLSGAYLRNADLSGADLSGAYFSDADLRSADLRSADLSGADLSGADLSGADLSGADLRRADLRSAENIPYYPLACPSDGAFVGWKKVNRSYLVKLLIPEDARRSSATTNKCRCDKAIVLEITRLNGDNTPIDKVVNHNYNHDTVYCVGYTVYPDSFDENRWNECSNGIHFFINKQDSINY